MDILIVEDNPAIAENIAQYFEAKAHVLDFAHNGTLGLELALSNHYDLVILDIMLPGMSGLAVCKKIREKATRHIPILMLTARDTLTDKVDGFEHGADDYLTKPFALEELEMRCLALSRRHLLQTQNVVNIGPLMIDRQQQLVTRNNIELELSAMNYNILMVLAEAFPKIVTRTELCQKLWGDAPTESDALRSHIYQLRQIVDKPFDEPIVKTVHGVGFALKVTEN